MPHEISCYQCFRAKTSPLLLPHLTHHPMNHGDVLAEPHDTISRVYFPLGGIISCVVPLSDGDAIESGMIGHEGEMGAALAQTTRWRSTESWCRYQARRLSWTPIVSAKRRRRAGLYVRC